MQSNTKDRVLIYEYANGVTYARFADDNTVPRWAVGGNIKGFIPGTNIQHPKDWYEFNDVRPDFNLILKHKKLYNAYTKFLKEAKKYELWEELHD